MLVLLLQLGLPLALIAWLAFGPARDRAGWLLQLLATAAVIGAGQIAGQWLILPYWTPWLLWVLFALAAQLGRKPDWGWPARWWEWLALPVHGGLLALGLWLIADAWRGYTMPIGPVADVGLPLAPGRYVVANGGSRESVSAHMLTFHPQTPRQRAFRGQSYGIDLVAIDAWGRHAPGIAPADPAAYAIWNREVRAPCAGTVVQALDGRPDMPVPDADRTVPPGNHVLLACGRHHILLAHLRRGSVAVRAGQRVARGTRLGAVGNSGNSSAPHLHIHAQTPGPPGQPFAGEPVPIRIGGRYLVRGDRL